MNITNFKEILNDFETRKSAFIYLTNNMELSTSINIG